MAGLFSTLEDRYFAWITSTKWVNRKVNRELRRISAAEELAIGLPVETIALTDADYNQFPEAEVFAKYKVHAFRHRKLMEYATSLRLLRALKKTESLCDFASGGDGYASFVKQKLNPAMEIVSIDPLNQNETRNGIRYVNGTAAKIDLPDASLDAITCHHSIEHFRGDQDTTAVREFMRLLKPGGRIVILPVFLTNMYAEICNRPFAAHQDPASRKITDYTSPFPGWKQFEHFARVYDAAAFRRRILSAVDMQEFDVRFVHVRMNGESVPDMVHNRSLPAFCTEMITLVIDKKPASL